MFRSFIFKNAKYLSAPVIIRFASIGNIVIKDSQTMTARGRYFVNKFTDYQNEAINISESDWKVQLFHIINNIEDGYPASTNKSDGGLYVGKAGIGYMFYYLSHMPLFANEKEDFLKHALTYVKAALILALKEKDDQASSAAFLLGNAGIHAVASVVFHAAGDKAESENYLKAYIDAASVCKPINFIRCGGDELLVGRAGYLAGIVWLEKVFGNGIIPKNVIHEICRSVVQSGRKYSQRYKSPCPLMYSYYEVEYLGAAHGLSSILQMLLSFPCFIQCDSSIERDVKQSVDYLLSLQTHHGNFPCALDEIGRKTRSESDELVHWCHGAPGVVYLMAKAYLKWKDEKYLKSCLKCGDLIWNKGLLKKGPGICHGVGGNGYVFLLLYRLTNDPKHLHRANVFAQFIFGPEFKHGARTPDAPYSLYEGLAGSVCFLADLLRPNEAAFPFMDVF